MAGSARQVCADYGVRVRAELNRRTGIVEAAGPGNPYQCRLYAGRCLALAKRARKPQARQVFTEMAETWNRLAAEMEADQFQGKF